MGWKHVQINSQVNKINKNIKKDKLDPINIQVLIELIEPIKNHVADVQAEEHPVKAQCSGLERAFRHATGWKDIPVLSKAAVQVNNIIVLAKQVVDDPNKAVAGGSWADVKGNLETLLQNLINALTATIQEVKNLKIQKEMKKV